LVLGGQDVCCDRPGNGKGRIVPDNASLIARRARPKGLIPPGGFRYRRPMTSLDPIPFAKGSTLNDVADWARKCCNGNTAEVK